MNKVAQKGMEKSSTCHEGSDFIEDVAEESWRKDKESSVGLKTEKCILQAEEFGPSPAACGVLSSKGM
jgi:hypothetical protein